MLTRVLLSVTPILLALEAGAGQTLALSSPRPAADSQHVLRGARSAQATFENTRRAHLPINTGGSSGRCDVRVGRLCYWWDEGEWSGPPEPTKIKAARAALLDRLAAAASRLPGDAWIAGQRVRYLVEDGRAADAERVARDCQASGSWCAALLGYSLHVGARFAEADSAFTAALEQMTEPERCRWQDITLLLEDKAKKKYEKLACAERAAFEARFWALSRPLHMLPANDLRTEHFARLTMIEMLRTSRYPHPMAWGDDMGELLLRYGWETRWSRDVPSMSSGASIHVVGHEPTPAFDFVPDAEVLAAPDSAEESDWMRRDRMAQSRYAPSYARSVAALDPQVALFRRGDSALVVAAFDLSRDTAFKHDSIAAALAVSPATTPESVVVVSATSARRRGALTASGAWRALLVSVEGRDSAERRVARSRLVARPPAAASGRVAVSDLLLFDDPSSLPSSVDDAIPRARGSLRVERREPVGVYWEMYGLDEAGATVSFTLTVTRVGVPWLRRAAERLKVAERRAPVRMKWDEPSRQPNGVRSRALAVDFSTLPAGHYRIDLSVEAEGQPPVIASRVVYVIDKH